MNLSQCVNDRRQSAAVKKLQHWESIDEEFNGFSDQLKAQNFVRV
jgi:hypothetical protein